MIPSTDFDSGRWQTDIELVDMVPIQIYRSAIWHHQGTILQL